MRGGIAQVRIIRSDSVLVCAFRTGAPDFVAKGFVEPWDTDMEKMAKVEVSYETTASNKFVEDISCYDCEEVEKVFATKRTLDGRTYITGAMLSIKDGEATPASRVVSESSSGDGFETLFGDLVRFQSKVDASFRGMMRMVFQWWQWWKKLARTEELLARFEQKKADWRSKEGKKEKDQAEQASRWASPVNSNCELW